MPTHSHTSGYPPALAAPTQPSSHSHTLRLQCSTHPTRLPIMFLDRLRAEYSLSGQWQLLGLSAQLPSALALYFATRSQDGTFSRVPQTTSPLPRLHRRQYFVILSSRCLSYETVRFQTTHILILRVTGQLEQILPVVLHSLSDAPFTIIRSLPASNGRRSLAHEHGSGPRTLIYGQNISILDRMM